MDAKPDRLRVALLADDFNPEWPSLPIVGFNYARALADHADVTVFTQIRNRENLEKLGQLGFEVIYIDTEYVASPMYKFAVWLRGGDELGWTIQIASNYLPYLEFERRAVRLIRRSKVGFDIVHRITPMSPTLPSYAAGRTGTPFIIGPLNGNLPWPREFSLEQQREREMLSKVKGIYKVLPFLRSTFRNASAVLAAFPHTVASLGKDSAGKVFDVPEIGYDPGIFYAQPRKRGDRLTFLYAGRLVPYKLPEVAVLAFAARSELRKHRLRIIGSGPERERLEKLVVEHRLQDCVEFVGRLSQREVADEMRKADVFFFPSIRELGAGVVIEALACGLPCLVADYGAPGALVNDSRGRKVPLADRATMIRGFANAAAQLASNRGALEEMSEESASYAQRTFTWDQKAAWTIAIYQWILGARNQRPEFLY
jgi:glycosyltransferase involved in cell wall biosynthesis